MHVGSVLVFEGDAPAYEELLEQIERRLHLVPRYRQKLAFAPLGPGAAGVGRRPALQRRLPRAPHGAAASPRARSELRQLAGRVFSQQLDRSKPLWEMWLVRRRRRATASRSSPRPTTRWSTASRAWTSRPCCSTSSPTRPRPTRAPPWYPRPEPSGSHAARRRAARARRRAARAGARRGRRAIARPARGRRDGRRARSPGSRRWPPPACGGAAAEPAATSAIGPHRRFAWVEADLDQLQGDQERARRHGQRRRARRRDRRPARAPARAAARPPRASS